MTTRPTSPFTRRQWLLSSGAALAGLALSSRFLNDELRAAAVESATLGAQPFKARLSLNENPFGPSPAATAAAVRNLTEVGAARYPFGVVPDLLALIAKKEGVKPEQIVLGVGSGEILETVGLHFGLLKGDVIYGTPGYVQLVQSAANAGGRAIGVPLNARLEHDLDAMAAKVGPGTSVIYLANPHNPTGTALEPAALRAFIREVTPKAFVFIDEAYLDVADNYAGRTVVDLVNQHDNLMVARTFSKIFGLAGLRIGYGVTNPKFAAKIRSYGVGSMNGPALAAAIASLQDAGYVAATREKIVAERTKLTDLLTQLGRRFAAPQANFVFFQTGRPHPEFHSAMLKHDVIVARAFAPLLDWARISIGLPEENAAARAALTQVLG